MNESSQQLSPNVPSQASPDVAPSDRSIDRRGFATLLGGAGIASVFASTAHAATTSVSPTKPAHDPELVKSEVLKRIREEIKSGQILIAGTYSKGPIGDNYSRSDGAGNPGHGKHV